MNSKYSRLEVNKVTDENGTATEHKLILEKVTALYQNLYKKRTLMSALTFSQIYLK